MITLLRSIRPILIASTLVAPCIAYGQGHGHIYAGDNNNDGYLDFMSLPALEVLEVADGRAWNAGFVFNTNVTFTAQYKKDFINDGPSEAGGALSGTYIYLVLQGISGPEGGSFAFYDAGGTSPLFTLETGQTGGTLDYGFNLTEDAWFFDDPSQPFGHIHGRTLAFDTAGTYTLTWALFNTEAGGTLSSIANPDGSLHYFTQTVTVIPEPGSIALLSVAAGVIVLAGYRRAAGHGR